MHYLIILLGALAFGIYKDATKQKIGAVPGETAPNNHTAGNWAARALLVVPAFTYYKNRPQLLARAVENPVETPHARRNGLLILCAMGVLVFLVTLSGVGGNVDMVRNGILEINQATTVGEAFENYSMFRSCTWESDTTANGVAFVNAVGELDMSLELPVMEALREEGVVRVEAAYQFVINRDGETFQYNAFGIRLTKEDGEILTRNPGQSVPVKLFDSKGRMSSSVPESGRALECVYSDEPLLTSYF